MKSSSIFIFYITSLLLITACTEETKKSHNESIKNPVDTYLDSRVNAMDMAKKSVNESNKRTEEQDKNINSLLKK